MVRMKLVWRFLVIVLVVLTSLFIFFQIKYQFSGLMPVDGWEPYMSRNLSHYINEDVEPHILPKAFCTGKKLLLVIVCSKPENFMARKAIRDTWGQKHQNISVWFLYGEVGKNYNLQYWIDIESALYHDIIQERFLDTYNNLTIKSVNMLKLFNKYCYGNYRFLMKSDDDIFLNNIQKLTYDLSREEKEAKILMGRKRQGRSPIRDKGSKWYMPYAWYPGDKYPDFLCGPTYLMSAQVVKELYQCTLQEPLLHTEDVFITGVCAEKKNINLINDDNFMCNWLSTIVCKYKHKYTFHKFTPNEIRTAYDEIQENCTVYSDVSVPKMWYTFFDLVHHSQPAP